MQKETMYTHICNAYLPHEAVAEISKKFKTLWKCNAQCKAYEALLDCNSLDLAIA